MSAAVKSTSWKKDRESSRKGKENYTSNDLDALLDIAQELIPRGTNEWSIILQQYSEGAEQHESHLRDVDAFKQTLDQLAAVEKPTSDLICPPYVCKATIIAENIMQGQMQEMLGVIKKLRGKNAVMMS